MTPRKFNIFTGNGWDKINEVWCSNDYFWRGRGYRNNHTGYKRLCSVGRCTSNAQAGKDTCEKCEGERKAQAEEVAGEKSVGQSRETSTVGIATGGTSRPLV